jgi:hypothetical protein
MPNPCPSTPYLPIGRFRKKRGHDVVELGIENVYSAAATARAIVLSVLDPFSHPGQNTYCRCSACCVQQPSWSVPSPPNRLDIFAPVIRWFLVCLRGWQLWWDGRIGHLCRVYRRWLCREWRRAGPCPWLHGILVSTILPDSDCYIPFPLDHCEGSQ